MPETPCESNGIQLMPIVLALSRGLLLINCLLGGVNSLSVFAMFTISLNSGGNTT